jgi:hypothetical protein
MPSMMYWFSHKNICPTYKFFLYIITLHYPPICKIFCDHQDERTPTKSMPI